MDEFGDFFLPSRGTYIPEKRLKQPTSSKTFLRNRLSPSGVSGPMDGCGWNWTTLQTSWMALPRLTSTLVLPQKIQAFLPEKNEPEGCGIEKDGKNPLPTNNKQKTYLKDCCFLELERHLWTFMRWFGVFGDVGKLLSFWGVARFFSWNWQTQSFFLSCLFGWWWKILMRSGNWGLSLHGLAPWKGQQPSSTTCDGLRGVVYPLDVDPGFGCLEKPLGDFEEKTPQQVLTSALIPSGTWKFFQEVPSWEESESLLKGSFRGASQEK